MTREEEESAHLRAAILEYFRRNPDAADTLEGVVHWWLTAEPERFEAVRVERVLEQLVAEGFAVNSVLVEGTVLYARAPGGSR